MSPPSGQACPRIRSQAARGSPRQNRARPCHARPGPSAAARAAGTRRSNSASHWSRSAGSRGRRGPARARNAPGRHRSRPGSGGTRSASVPARASRSRPPSIPAGPAGNRGLCPAPRAHPARPWPPRVPDPRAQVAEDLVINPDTELLRPERSHPASFARCQHHRAPAVASDPTVPPCAGRARPDANAGHGEATGHAPRRCRRARAEGHVILLGCRHISGRVLSGLLLARTWGSGADQEAIRRVETRTVNRAMIPMTGS